MRTDGSLGCATPCVLCRRALIAFDLRVSCPPGASGGGWYCGRLCSPDAPAPTLTSGQRRLLGHASPPKEGSRRSAARRKNKGKAGADTAAAVSARRSAKSHTQSFDHYTCNDGTSFRDGGSGDGSDFWRVNGGTGGRTGAAAAAANNAARRRRRGVSVGDVSCGFVAVSGAAAGKRGGGGGVSPPAPRPGRRVPGPAQPAARTWFEDRSCSGAEESARNGGGGGSSSSSDGSGGGGNSNNGNNRGRRSRRGRQKFAEKDLPLPQRGAPPPPPLPPPPLPPLPSGRRSRVSTEWKEERDRDVEVTPGTPPRRSELTATARYDSGGSSRSSSPFSSSSSSSSGSSNRRSVSPSTRRS